MDESLRQIANNAGSEGSVVIAKVKTARALLAAMLKRTPMKI